MAMRPVGPPDFTYTAEQIAKLEQLFQHVEDKTITWLDPDNQVAIHSPPLKPEEKRDS